KGITEKKIARIMDVDRVLLKRKWSLIFKLCLKELTNEQLLEHLSNDFTYFIEGLKDYNDLFLPFSTRYQIIEFIIRAIYDASFLNKDEIIYLLERLQNAENNVLTKNLNICKIDFTWNIIIEKFCEEIFSTDQQVLEFFEQFTNGITCLNYAENVFFLARLQNNLLSIEQVSEFLSKFANGIVNLSKVENAFFLARLKISIILCVNFQSLTLHQDVLFLSQLIFNDKTLKDEEKIYLHNYLQNDYRNDIKHSIFSNIEEAKNHLLKHLNIRLFNRPSAKELCETLDFWIKDNEAVKIFEESDKIIFKAFLSKTIDKFTQNAQVNISQLIDGLLLPTPVNSNKNSELYSSKFKLNTSANTDTRISNFDSAKLYQQELASSLSNFNILESHEISKNNITNYNIYNENKKRKYDKKTDNQDIYNENKKRKHDKNTDNQGVVIVAFNKYCLFTY
ncbi:20402_t:CDS:2, partial [Dentiscutata erythropus]